LRDKVEEIKLKLAYGKESLQFIIESSSLHLSVGGNELRTCPYSSKALRSIMWNSA
jgi:hypothetical protein